MVVAANIQRALKIIKDDQLGRDEFQFCLIIINNCLLITAEKVLKWLSAPDSSKNYNEAREKHQKDTCSWFLDGTWFRDLQDKAGILWIKGIGKLSNKCLALWSVLNNYTAGCGKTILW
jgi:hypothetical protein